jgi:para-nitrobenzyl esterase
MQKMRVWAFAALLFVAPAVAAAPALAPTAQTAQGALAGDVEDGIAVFRGIPFAASPVGELRWRAPKPFLSWTGTRQARDFGAICPQPKTTRTAALKQSEDCLTLNVWAPQGTKLPVMVWIYGGSFRTGGSAMHIYDGTDLAKHGVIVVSFNYRLGVLGFLDVSGLGKNIPGEPAANFGLLDQIAALKWVHDNIAAFGGDPDNVTIFGESAGAMSVNELMVSPAARGLFAKAISESGLGLLATKTKADAQATSRAFAARHNASGSATLDTLRALSPTAIVADEGRNGAGRDVGPEVDGQIIPEQVPDLFAKGEFAKVPYLTGWNSNEASLMPSLGDTTGSVLAQLGEHAAQIRAIYEKNGKLSDDDFAAQLFDDDVFGIGAQGLAGFVAAGGQPSYVYHFAYVAENFRGRFKGVDHAAEIPYVFGTRGLDLPFYVTALIGTITPNDDKIIAQMQSYWTNFAKTGNPNAMGLTEWPTFQPDHTTLVVDNNGLGARADFRKDELTIGFMGWSKRSGLAAP